uniref:NADH:ubiquinone reductase (H(+)-translocating) n=1 Tax=Lepidotrigona flavibasis TaxID=2696055 RepID=A0A6B9N0D1_9HYME|nr:NADH dehydrogenase subunit 5 [Lepidotrigona flavibasis]
MNKMFVFGIMLFLLSIMMINISMYLISINTELMVEWNIVSINSMKMNMIMVFNYKTLSYMFLVMFISSMIMMYSVEYMNIDNNLIKRFYYLMMMFLISMIMLIISPNMLTIMLGWDMLGLTSYCLIIYYNKNSSLNSGMVTILLNRLGDASLIMIIAMMSMFGSWNMIVYKLNNIIMIMLIIMAFSKSAQFPLFIWLPMAMMAPTPVSSLVHSSTLVTAGVYLMIIYNKMLNIEYEYIIMFVSSITMMFSGLMANFEMDLKKIIAFSTLSQLGFMMSIISMGMYDLAFLHLFIHALFKSMIFMCVGSFIHYMNGMQNFRFYKGFFYIYPVKSMLIIMSLMMMCGFPFLVGFYSKDIMIETYMMSTINVISFMMLIMGTMMTVSYSVRIVKLMMSKSMMKNIVFKKESTIMNMVMMIMMVTMIFISKMIHDIMFSWLKYNMMMFYKLFVFKMFILGFMMENYLSKLNSNKIILIMKNMFYMVNMFKIFKLKYFVMINYYTKNIEKNFIEIMISNTNVIINTMVKKILFLSKISVYSMVLMYFYIILIFCFY